MSHLYLVRGLRIKRSIFSLFLFTSGVLAVRFPRMPGPVFFNWHSCVLSRQTLGGIGKFAEKLTVFFLELGVATVAPSECLLVAVREYGREVLWYDWAASAAICVTTFEFASMDGARQRIGYRN